MPCIKLKSSDNRMFEVDVSVARRSELIKTMLDDLGFDENGGDDEIVPVTQVTGNILEMVIEWAEHHRNDPIDDQEQRTEMSEWDSKFVQVDKLKLFALVRAANFLNVKQLLDITCKAVANLVKEKSTKEIRQLFDLD